MFVIKSFSEDDVHKSIKYNIWASTDQGNRRLDKAFQELAGRGPLYLFFSVNGSGYFVGMAQMTSAVDYASTSTVWAQVRSSAKKLAWRARGEGRRKGLRKGLGSGPRMGLGTWP